MINSMMEHPMEHARAEERRREMLGAAAQARLLAGSGRDARSRSRAFGRRAGSWLGRALRLPRG